VPGVRKAAGILSRHRTHFTTIKRSSRILSAFMPSSLHKKYLKAYLVFQDQDFPKTHALEDLVLLAAVKDPGCKHLFIIASELSPYAVEIRYPDSTSPTVQDARDSGQSADTIRKYVLNRMKTIE
jgi:HEPN domain-containing protein